MHSAKFDLHERAAEVRDVEVTYDLATNVEDVTERGRGDASEISIL